jgi:hypothetical protein
MLACTRTILGSCYQCGLIALAEAEFLFVIGGIHLLKALLAESDLELVPLTMGLPLRNKGPLAPTKCFSHFKGLWKAAYRQLFFKSSGSSFEKILKLPFPFRDRGSESGLMLLSLLQNFCAMGLRLCASQQTHTQIIAFFLLLLDHIPKVAFEETHRVVPQVHVALQESSSPPAIIIRQPLTSSKRRFVRGLRQ